MSSGGPHPIPERICEDCKKPFRPFQAHFRTCPECHRKRMATAGPGPSPRWSPAPERSREEAARPMVPDDYLKEGYFSDPDRGVMFPELLTTTAAAWAQELARANVSMGQVRRYYTMARALDNRLSSGEDFGVVANELRRMKSNVAAIVGRTQEDHQRAELERTLKRFLDANIDAAVADRRSFAPGFLTHFQCVLGYFTYYSGAGGRRRGA